jgi:RNA polymerase sigma-70 factor (ECF subfamily)
MTAVFALPRTNHVAKQFPLVDSGTSDDKPGGLPQRTADKQGGLSPHDLEVFIRDYSGRLLAVAKRFLHRDEDAADAVQDALLSALQSRHTFDGNSTVYTWLYRIVVNVCLMKIRSRPRATTVPLDELLPLEDHGCRRRPVSRVSEQAENRLEREELRAVVRACIDRLPDDYRTIVWLRDIEELDTNATAQLLDLSRAAVKTRLHRARQALRRLLEPALS